MSKNTVLKSNALNFLSNDNNDKGFFDDDIYPAEKLEKIKAASLVYDSKRPPSKNPEFDKHKNIPISAAKDLLKDGLVKN